MSLDTLTKYPVTNSSFAVFHSSNRAIDFGNHLTVGSYSDPINGNNGSRCAV
jgi:hypothetical protein